MSRPSRYLNVSKICSPLLANDIVEQCMSAEKAKILGCLQRSDQAIRGSTQGRLAFFYFEDKDLMVHVMAVEYVCEVLGIPVPVFAVKQTLRWTYLVACNDGANLKDPAKIQDLLAETNEMHRFNLVVLEELVKCRAKILEASEVVDRFVAFFIPPCGPIMPATERQLALHKSMVEFWKTLTDFLELLSKVVQFECNMLYVEYAARPYEE